MYLHDDLAGQVESIDANVLAELVMHATALDRACKATAEHAGQLYMKADEAGVGALTEMLDKPMRNASDRQQTFAGVLAELQMVANRSA